MNGKRIYGTGFAFLLVAALASAQPAAADGARYKAIGFGAAAGAGIGPVLWAKRAANRAIDRALGLADKQSSAVISGNDALAREAEDDLDKFTSDWVKESMPGFGLASRVREAVGNAGAKLKRMASTVKRRTKNFVGGDDADPRIALTRSPDRKAGSAASRIFASKPLPKANVGAAVSGIRRSTTDVAGTRTWKSATGKNEEELLWTDVAGTQASPAVLDLKRRIGTLANGTTQTWKSVAPPAVPDSVGFRRPVQRKDRDGYETALAKALGEERGAAPADYMGTLETLERQAAERLEEKRQARLEQERLERLHEERQARIREELERSEEERQARLEEKRLERLEEEREEESRVTYVDPGPTTGEMIGQALKALTEALNNATPPAYRVNVGGWSSSNRNASGSCPPGKVGRKCCPPGRPNCGNR